MGRSQAEISDSSDQCLLDTQQRHARTFNQSLASSRRLALPSRLLVPESALLRLPSSADLCQGVEVRAAAVSLIRPSTQQKRRSECEHGNGQSHLPLLWKSSLRVCMLYLNTHTHTNISDHSSLDYGSNCISRSGIRTCPLVRRTQAQIQAGSISVI